MPQKGLPSWWAERDIHQNGQITMAEYGAGKTWTDELAADFAKYDLNNDGIITPDEAIKATTPPANPAGKADAAKGRYR